MTAQESLTPHVVVDGLLPEKMATFALVQLTRLLPQFRAATVVGGKSPNRLSWIFNETTGVDWIGDVADKALAIASAWPRCSPAPNLFLSQVQCTYTHDRGFYRPHRDATSDSNHDRQFTFVYYLHTQPRRFTGGDLLIFGGLDDGTMYAPNSFDRIDPRHNRLVVFPSCRVHEVQHVIAPSALGLGRFCVNGWIGKGPP